MIEIKHISKNYGQVAALRDINLTLNRGEVVCLLGPNGAGKSTLMRLISGYITPSSGEILVLGHNVQSADKAAAACLGYVPENGPLYGEMNVYEYLRYVADLWQISTAEFEENLQIVLTNLQLSEVLLQRIDTLSKGFKHRVAIAGALIHKPRILILDEPTEGLDPNQKEQIHRFIREYSRGRLIIVSTHIMEEVAAVGDRAVLINKGHLIWNAPADELRMLAPDNDMNTAFRLLTGEK